METYPIGYAAIPLESATHEAWSWTTSPHGCAERERLGLLEQPLVVGVLAPEGLEPLGGDPDAPLRPREVAGDQALLEELQDPLRRRLLAHAEVPAELPRGHRDRPAGAALEGDALQGLQVRGLHPSRQPSRR